MEITGTYFQDGALVYFGGVLATDIVVVGPTTITCLTPPHAGGFVDVQVLNPDGQSDTLVDGFEYISTAWAPTDIPGCVLWFDASQIDGLVDGDPVATWPDLANGHDATAAGADRPTYKENILNGLPVVRGDGTNIMITGAMVENCGTIFAVLGNCSNGGGYPSIGAKTPGSPGSGYAWARILTFNSNTTFYQDINNIFSGLGTHFVDGVETANLGDTGYKIVRLVGDSPLAVTSLALLSSVINARLAGDLAELIVYDTILGASDIATVEANLATKWHAVYDSFTDTNGVLLTNHLPEKGGPWVQWQLAGGNPTSIQNNMAQHTSSTPREFTKTVLDAGSPNVDLTFAYHQTIDHLSGMVFRGQDTDNCLIAIVEPWYDKYEMYKVVAGAWTLLGSLGEVIDAGAEFAHLRVTCNDSDLLTFYANYASKIQVTDATHNTKTFVGIYQDNVGSPTTAKWDGLTVSVI